MPGRATLALRAGACTSGPQPVGRAAGHRDEVRLHRLQQGGRRRVAADGEGDLRPRRHVLPAANVAHRPQHLLETAELGLDPLVAAAASHSGQGRS